MNLIETLERLTHVTSVDDYLIIDFHTLLREAREMRDTIKDLHDADWTPSLCDRLNEIVRENTRDLPSECRDGPSASDLIRVIHGKFNEYRARNAELVAENAKLREIVDRAKGLLSWLREQEAADTAIVNNTHNYPLNRTICRERASVYANIAYRVETALASEKKCLRCRGNGETVEGYAMCPDCNGTGVCK